MQKWIESRRKFMQFWNLRFLVFCKASLLKMRFSQNQRCQKFETIYQKSFKNRARKNVAKIIKNHEQLTKNEAQIHHKSIKNQSKNRCRKMDVQKSIKIDPLSVQGPKKALRLLIGAAFGGLGGPRPAATYQEIRGKQGKMEREMRNWVWHAVGRWPGEF